MEKENFWQKKRKKKEKSLEMRDNNLSVTVEISNFDKSWISWIFLDFLDVLDFLDFLDFFSRIWFFSVSCVQRTVSIIFYTRKYIMKRYTQSSPLWIGDPYFGFLILKKSRSRIWISSFLSVSIQDINRLILKLSIQKVDLDFFVDL